MDVQRLDANRIHITTDGTEPCCMYGVTTPLMDMVLHLDRIGQGMRRTDLCDWLAAMMGLPVEIVQSACERAGLPDPVNGLN
jgi:hypothetical protein